MDFSFHKRYKGQIAGRGGDVYCFRGSIGIKTIFFAGFLATGQTEQAKLQAKDVLQKCLTQPAGKREEWLNKMHWDTATLPEKIRYEYLWNQRKDASL